MNVDCRDTPTLLVKWSDTDLSTDETDSLEEHMRGCAACRAERERFLKVDRELASYGEFVRQEEGGAPAARRPGFRLSWVFALGVAAMAAAVIWVPWVQQPTGTPPRPVLETPALSEGRFVPIPYVPPLAPYESARVVHTDIPVASLIAAGYRVSLTDPAAIVPADLLVGEDGRVHAIRLLADGILN